MIYSLYGKESLPGLSHSWKWFKESLMSKSCKWVLSTSEVCGGSLAQLLPVKTGRTAVKGKSSTAYKAKREGSPNHYYLLQAARPVTDVSVPSLLSLLWQAQLPAASTISWGHTHTQSRHLDLLQQEHRDASLWHQSMLYDESKTCSAILITLIVLQNLLKMR